MIVTLKASRDMMPYGEGKLGRLRARRFGAVLDKGGLLVRPVRSRASAIFDRAR